jgi:molybdate transport system substrate-binding protein
VGGTAVPAAVDFCNRDVEPQRAALGAAMRFVLTLIFAALLAAPAAAQEKITVFAAASLRNALDEVDAAFTRATGIAVNASYAASSALARQIEQGAPADVFLSADSDWMDYLQQRQLIAPATHVNLLGNALVLIAPKNSPLANVDIAPGVDLAKLAGGGRIAVADVHAVPAGLYAKAALTKLGAWASVRDKLAQAENVRAALSYVARGEAPLGIVYATDAKAEPGVKIVGTFPADSHPPIVYPAAAIKGRDNDVAKRYLQFLRSAETKAIFEKYGFSVFARSEM